MPNRQLRVFLCRSSTDKPAVRELYKKLYVESWLDPWLDEEKLLPGQDWHMEIKKAVEVTNVVVVLLSNQSVSQEGYVQRDFPWGNEFDKNKCNSDEGKKGRTTSVGLYSPQGDTPYGCADMAGNVWEWTHSGIKAYLYNANDRREDEQKSVSCILHGGSFYNGSDLARSASRYRNDPDYWIRNFGFRVVMSPILPS